jgi:hypothetical protein
LEDKIIILQNIIDEKDIKFNKMHNKLETNKKVMINEYEYNMMRIAKLKQYISDLNDHIENNMTTNEIFNEIKIQLEDSLKSKNELVNEIETMRLNTHWNTFVNDDSWNVSDDKWIDINVNIENDINSYDDFVSDDKWSDVNVNDINSYDDFVDNNEMITQTNENSSEEYSNYDDNNYDDFVDEMNENELSPNNNLIKQYIIEYNNINICSDNQYDSFIDNKSENENTIDEECNDSITDGECSSDYESNHDIVIDVDYDDFVDDDIVIVEDDDFVDNEVITAGKDIDYDFVDDEVMIVEKDIDYDFIDDESIDEFIDSELLYEKLQNVHKVLCDNYPLELNNNELFVDDKIIDLRDSYHIVQNVDFDEKIFHEYKSKQKTETEYFPRKYTIIDDYF